MNTSNLKDKIKQCSKSLLDEIQKIKHYLEEEQLPDEVIITSFNGDMQVLRKLYEDFRVSEINPMLAIIDAIENLQPDEPNDFELKKLKQYAATLKSNIITASPEKLDEFLPQLDRLEKILTIIRTPLEQNIEQSIAESPVCETISRDYSFAFAMRIAQRYYSLSEKEADRAEMTAEQSAILSSDDLGNSCSDMCEQVAKKNDSDGADAQVTTAMPAVPENIVRVGESDKTIQDHDLSSSTKTDKVVDISQVGDNLESTVEDAIQGKQESTKVSELQNSKNVQVSDAISIESVRSEEKSSQSHISQDAVAELTHKPGTGSVELDPESNSSKELKKVIVKKTLTQWFQTQKKENKQIYLEALAFMSHLAMFTLSKIINFIENNKRGKLKERQLKKILTAMLDSLHREKIIEELCQDKYELCTEKIYYFTLNDESLDAIQEDCRNKHTYLDFLLPDNDFGEDRAICQMATVPLEIRQNIDENKNNILMIWFQSIVLCTILIEKLTARIIDLKNDKYLRWYNNHYYVYIKVNNDRSEWLMIGDQESIKVCYQPTYRNCKSLLFLYEKEKLVAEDDLLKQYIQQMPGDFKLYSKTDVHSLNCYYDGNWLNYPCTNGVQKDVSVKHNGNSKEKKNFKTKAKELIPDLKPTYPTVKEKSLDNSPEESQAIPETECLVSEVSECNDMMTHQEKVQNSSPENQKEFKEEKSLTDFKENSLKELMLDEKKANLQMLDVPDASSPSNVETAVYQVTRPSEVKATEINQSAAHELENSNQSFVLQNQQSTKTTSDSAYDPDSSHVAEQESIKAAQPQAIGETFTLNTPYLSEVFDTHPDLSVSDYAQQLLGNQEVSPEKDQKSFLVLLYKILDQAIPTSLEKGYIESSLGDAILLSQALANTEKEPGVYQDILRKLLYASDSISSEYEVCYDKKNISAVIDSNYGCADGIRRAILMRALFAPHADRDYELRRYAQSYTDNEQPDCFRKLFKLLLSLHEPEPTLGYNRSCIDIIGTQNKQEKILEKYAHKAAETIANPPTALLNLHNPQLVKALFGENEEISQALNIVKKKETQRANEVRNLLNTLDFGSPQLDNRLREKIQTAWNSHATINARGRADGWVFEQSKRPMKFRLDFLNDWLGIINKSRPEYEKLRSKKNEVEQCIKNALDSLQHEKMTGPERYLLGNMLVLLQELLNGTDFMLRRRPFTTALHTGCVMFDEDYIPRIKQVSKFPLFEPWRNILRHLVVPHKTLDETLQMISENSDASDTRFDDLCSRNLIQKLLKKDQKLEDLKDNNANASLLDCAKEYQGRIELAYAYGQITEIEKENMCIDMQTMQGIVCQTNEYGYFRRFLHSLDERTKLSSQRRRDDFERQIREKEKRHQDVSPAKRELLDNIRTLAFDRGNYEVAEEYLNRWPDSLEGGISDNELIPEKKSYLEEFIEQYPTLYDLCQPTDRGSKFVGINLEPYLRNRTNANKETTKQLLKEWANGITWRYKNKNAALKSLRMLFQGMGFNEPALEAKDDDTTNEKRYSLNLKPVQKNLRIYASPFAEFGTMPTANMDVVVICRTRETIRDFAQDLNAKMLSPVSIVFYDKSLTLLQRRQLAEEFHNTESHNQTVLVIDKVLFLYLSTMLSNQLQVLLCCTLPFTCIQPFVDEAGAVTDEMFRGRTEYLDMITNFNTSSLLLYGGRQLGKTAILTRAANMVHDPEHQRYAVFLSIKTFRSEDEVMKKLREIAKNRDVVIQSNNFRELLAELLPRFRTDAEPTMRIHAMLILFDEADNFLEACSQRNYETLETLVELTRLTENRFKFVFAGLHNVCRMKNAIARNGVLGQLPARCVKPFTSREAQQLLEIPLKYLGYNFEKREKLELILSKSNYYPGILHFFGHNLLNSLADTYTNYYQANSNNPPCVLEERQLQATIADRNLNRAINEKLSLTLDLDVRYRLLAMVIAFNYYIEPEQRQEGSSVQDICNIAEELELRAIAELSVEDCCNLLEEMTEMAVLQKISDHHFRLRKLSFLSLFGGNGDEVLAALEQYNKSSVEA